MELPTLTLSLSIFMKLLLSDDDRARVARIVTVLAYNCPDIPYIPLIYPVSALFLMSGISEETTYR